MGKLIERLERIVEVSYEILCGKVVSGSIVVSNEASLQLQFGVILTQIGKLFEYENNDRFTIALEEVQNSISTIKSNDKARCDIMLKLFNGKTECKVAIELKYFRRQNGKTETITQNRFGVYCDIQNLEKYDCNVGYEIVYTNNINYTKSDSISMIPLGNEQRIKSLNHKKLYLNNEYDIKWDSFDENHHFLKIKVLRVE